MNKTINIKYFSFLICVFEILLSCKPRVAVKINSNKEIFVDVNITPMESTKKIIKSFSKISSDRSFFEENEESIENILTEDGVKIKKFKKTSSLDIDLAIQFPNNSINSSIFSIDEKTGTLNFSLSREKLRAFVKSMQDEDKGYIELLMAPSLQDVNMSEHEYASLIASAYGKKVTNELLSSNIALSVEVPHLIKNVNTRPNIKSEIRGKKAFINIPITKVLVMNEPIIVTVNYSQ